MIYLLAALFLVCLLVLILGGWFLWQASEMQKRMDEENKC